MLFNSFTFLYFLAIVLLCFYALPRARAKQWFVLAASYVFYGWWDWRFLGLLFLSTIIDYSVGFRLDREARPGARKLLLALSLVANLGFLGFFKYFNFFAESATALLQNLGFQPHSPTLSIILPVGISFYTFQTLAYSMDLYRRRIHAEHDLVLFALYVSFFPQLVAGPIERPDRLIPQLRAFRRPTSTMVEKALGLILLGYALKFMLADFVAPEVNRIFEDPGRWHSGTLLSGAYLFGFQIFGDFAGYSAIARGVALLLGVELMVNFRQPYFASNITDFWRRWHISLSTWLRDYLYVFWLGGNRRGRVRTNINLWLTMCLGGLWHGANWTFVVWGGLHGAALSTHKAWTRRRGTNDNAARGRQCGSVRRSLETAAGAALTFHFVTLAWVFFRARNLGEATVYLKGILRFGHIVRIMPLVVFSACVLVALEALSYWLNLSEQRSAPETPQQVRPAWQVGTAYGVMGLLCVLFRPGNEINFIYFQF